MTDFEVNFIIHSKPVAVNIKIKHNLRDIFVYNAQNIWKIKSKTKKFMNEND